MNDEADVVIVGAGLAGLVAAAELVDAGRRIVILEQEPEASLGGQAFWSFGGLFFVNSPDQRRMGIRDSYELDWQAWRGSAGLDREDEYWAPRRAAAYLGFAAGLNRHHGSMRGLHPFPHLGQGCDWGAHGA